MTLDHSLIGVPSEPQLHSWSSADALLYALAVGAGLDDPTQDLAFTTENSSGVTQRVLPTFGVLLSRVSTGRKLGDFDPAMLVHAEQSFDLHRPLPPTGTVRVTTTVTGIHDKGSGALVVSESAAVDPESGEPVVDARSSAFIRGEGGFGGDRGPRSQWRRPERDPDHVLTCPTRPEQALIYRLCGDRNPLHSDPVFAARAGFDRPILHGLCTYGVTGRALLHAFAGSDPALFEGMSGRFSSPVYPGETLTVSAWEDGGTVLFQTAKPDGTVVIDQGQARIRPA